MKKEKVSLHIDIIDNMVNYIYAIKVNFLIEILNFVVTSC